MKYPIVENLPVARFFYKGAHSHPVRRTVLIIEANKDYIRGYELREGKIVRTANRAPIKTYLRNRIAKGKSLRPDNYIRTTNPEKSTLIRTKLIDIVEIGA